MNHILLYQTVYRRLHFLHVLHFRLQHEHEQVCPLLVWIVLSKIKTSGQFQCIIVPLLQCLTPGVILLLPAISNSHATTPADYLATPECTIRALNEKQAFSADPASQSWPLLRFPDYL